MKVLVIHAEEFSMRITERALREAEEPPEPAALALRNALVVFISVEEGDGSVVDAMATRFVDDLKSLVVRLRPSAVVLYPYAHLSRNLAKPEEALKILKSLEAKSCEVLEGTPVYRAPFGWYKQFTIACYGHPLSELSREYRPEDLPSAASPANKCYVLNEGVLQTLDLSQTYREGLDAVLLKHACLTKETSREWRVGERVRELLSKFSLKLMKSAGGIILCKVGPGVDIDGYLLRMSESVASELIREYSLRGTRVITGGYASTTYESDDVTSRHKDLIVELQVGSESLPYYIYEVTTVYKTPKMEDFRSSLSSMRKPQLTVFTKDEGECIKLTTHLFKLLVKGFETLELKDSLTPVIVVSSRGFEESVQESISKLLSNSFDKVVLVVKEHAEIGWGLTIELHYIDSGGASTLVSRTSIENKTGIHELNSKNMLTISSELLGPSEVLTYALIDRAFKLETSGKTPYLPSILMPTQVRIIPVGSNVVTYANSVAEKLAKAGVRVDVDARELGLGRRIRDAGMEWIPYIVVVGEREKETNTLNVRMRHLGLQKSLSIEEFTDLLKHQLNFPSVS